MSRSEWMWSQPHEDYYCYELNPATNQYDKIIWGRSEVGPPAARPSPYPAPHSGTTYVPSRSSNQHPLSSHSQPKLTNPLNSTGTDAPRAATQHTPYEYSTNISRVVGGSGGSSHSYSSAYTGSSDMEIDPASDDEEMRGYESYSRQTRGPEFRHYLDNRYEQIQRPSRYFKKGRIFIMVWHEQGISPQSITKIRRFVVMRNKGSYCICLCIHTYGGQATAKAGVKPNDHAPLVCEGMQVQLHPHEPTPIKQELVALMEDSTISLSPYSRIDFGKIYTINVNSRVRTIGRISPSYLGLLEEYFRSGIGVNEPDEEHDFGRTTYVSPPTFIDSSSTFSGPHRVKDNDSKNSPPPIFKNSTSTYPAPHIFEHTSLPTISKAIPQVGLTEEIKKTEDNEANKGDIPSRTTHEPISTPVIPTRPALYSPDLGGRAMSATMKNINPATDLTDLDDSASDDEEFNGQKTLGDDKGILDSRYQTIKNPKRFFKRGTVFMALWSEPRASVNTQKVYSKIRRFIVIKYMQSHSICVPIHTYSGQGTSKPGVNPADHAPLVKNNEEVVYHELEDKMAINKMPLSLIVEDLTINFNPYSRVCFSKPHTFQHNIKVRKIGRIAPGHLPRLIQYYRERVGVMDTDADDVEELMEAEVEDMGGSMELKSDDMEGLMEAETDHTNELTEAKHDGSEDKGEELQEKAKASSFSE